MGHVQSTRTTLIGRRAAQVHQLHPSRFFSASFHSVHFARSVSWSYPSRLQNAVENHAPKFAQRFSARFLCRLAPGRCGRNCNIAQAYSRLSFSCRAALLRRAAFSCPFRPGGGRGARRRTAAGKSSSPVGPFFLRTRSSNRRSPRR